MIKKFKIQNIILDVNTNNFLKNNLNIKSFPRNYNVEINNNYKKLIDLINQRETIIIIDKNIFNKYFSKNNIKNKKIIKIEAKEKYKDLNTINKILNFFVKNNVSKSNKIYGIGGGIIQDLVGYSSLIKKEVYIGNIYLLLFLV